MDRSNELSRARTGGLTARRARLVVSGDVAQLVEHRLCKAGVRGSIPLVSTRESFGAAVRLSGRRSS